MANYTYCVPENCEESRYDFASKWDKESPEYLAEDAAENYHDLHDGFENDWPLIFRLFDHNGTVIGDFEVEREMSPRFSAASI